MILFRVEGTARRGFGHLNRCSYLVSNFFRKEAVFLAQEKETLRFLAERGHRSLLLREELPDLAGTSGLLFDLDSFSELDLALLARGRDLGVPLFQITDLGLQQQPVDLTFDSSPRQITPYPAAGRVALGPQYAILHHRFRHFNKVGRRYRKQARKIFISLGGGGDYRRLRDIIEALYRKGFFLKIAAGFTLKANIRKKLQRVFPGISFCLQQDTLARPIFEADLALVSSGVLAYEAAAAGTPALYLWHHQLQEFQARSFEECGWGKAYGALEGLQVSEIAGLLKAIDYPAFSKLGWNGKNAVDGLGAIRVYDRIVQEMQK